MNDIFALVLFGSEATGSFVSLALNKRFIGAPGELNCPLDVEIVDDRSIRLVRVHRGSHTFAWEQGYYGYGLA